MLPLEQTDIQNFSFGDNPEDQYFILYNKKISQNGLDVNKLSKSDPRTFDATLSEMGCILMLNGQEVDELIRRDNIKKENLHTSLYSLAVKEGVIR